MPSEQLAAVLVLGSIVLLLVLARLAGVDQVLDRAAIERIRDRVAEVSLTSAELEQRDRENLWLDRIRDRRATLWRDTSSVLIVLGVVLMAVVLVNPSAFAGGVLGVTSVPGAPSSSLDGAEQTAGGTERHSRTPAPRTPPPAPTPVHAPTPGSSPSAAPRPSATPAPTPAEDGPPSADRMAVLRPCPGESGCYFYEVRPGDNLTSIANWFGIPLATVLDGNPQVRDAGVVHSGDLLRLPTPRR